MESRIEEFGLESSNLLDVLYMPVLHCVSSLVERSLTTTRSVEKDTIKSLRILFPELSRIERDTDIRTSHPLCILQELWYSLSSWLIGNHKTIWKVLSKLCGLASRAGCHIEDEEII